MVNLKLSLSISNAQGIKHTAFGYSTSFSQTCSFKFPSCFYVTNSNQPIYPISMFSAVNQQNVAAILLGDGSESRLYTLTNRRSEGAIPIAANYRLVDAVVSNCINSNISKVYALAQFNSTSLNCHLSRAYSRVGVGKDHGFVEVIAACQSPNDHRWFQGDADAVRRRLWILEEHEVSDFLVLPCHHLYKMDYQRIMESHIKSNVDITIASLSSMRDHDPGFGILKLGSQNQVLEFMLNSDRELVTCFSGQNSRKSNAIAQNGYSSMGIYLIKRDTMVKLLREYFPRANDFSSEVIPAAISLGMKVQAFPFDGYWEDMRNIEAFYEANMDCTKKKNNGYRFSGLYIAPASAAESYIQRGNNRVSLEMAASSMCKIERAVIGMRTRIGDGAVIKDSVIMGNDVYQTGKVQRDRKSTNIQRGIGDNCYIRKAIVDKNARIGKNVKIINKDNVQESNR